MCLSTGPSCHCLTEGNPCEPCSMTAKEMESQSPPPPSNISAAINTFEHEPHVAEGKERRRNWGWVASGIICVNVLMLGCALSSGMADDDIKIKISDLQIYLIILLFLTAIWMVYYSIFTLRNDNAVVYQDAHAGPVWLRGGMVLFGLLSIIMDIFKIASYVGYLHCDSGVKVAFPVVQLVFLVVQTYFFWIHSKDCMQLQKNVTRCGLMLTLSTNLVVWMTAVTEESVHQTIIPDDDSNYTKLTGRDWYIQKAGYGDSKCKCSHSSCSMFKEAYYYLYPFNIEYSLFASAMAYVMWKNVGRVADDHGHHDFKFRVRDSFIGPVLGVLLAITGLATFIVYEMTIVKGDEKKTDHVVMMHFIMNIVIVTTMSIACMIGSAVYRLEQRELNSDKNPTRSLDVGLLVGASLGQIVINYFTIVAMIATKVKGTLNKLNLAWAFLMVIELGLQNFFIIEGLHREPFHEAPPVTVLSNPYVLQPGKELSISSLEDCDMEKKPCPELTESSLHSHTDEHRSGLSWKRRVLKDVCAFLVMGNIILWIMPAFGARPQFDHDTEAEFYNFKTWAAVVNVGLPFGIFYRMHSVASLFEVFLMS